MKLHLPLALSISLLASFGSVAYSETVLWNAGAGTWSDASASEWTPAVAPVGQDVVFSATGQGTVSIAGSVTPSSVSVQGGTYIFQQSGAAGGGIESGGTFSVEGDGTQLTLASANAGLSGELDLGGGTLVLGAENAIGSATLLFNGGTLAYADGITQDLSAQIGTGSTSMVRVDVGGNEVTWGNRTTSDIPGFVTALNNGIEKSGSGTLTLLEIQGGYGTYAGDITVQGGRLNIYADYASSAPGNSAAITLNGNLAVAGGAWLSLGTTFDSSSGKRLILAGSMSGTGTVEIGNPENYHTGAENKAGGGRYAISGDNSSFEGTLRLSGLASASTALYNGCELASAAALGGASSRLQLNGRQFWISQTLPVHSLPMAVELVADSNSVFHPNANQIYNFSNTLSGSGTLTGLDNRSATIQFSGNIAGCTGTLASGIGNVFLLGGENAASPGGEIAMTLSGNGAFAIEYSSPVTLAGVVRGTASLQQRGHGALTLAADNTTTGTLTVDEGCTVNIGTSTTPSTWAGGSVAGTGTLVLVNGGLSTDIGAPTAKIVVDAAAGRTVTAGGTDGSHISRITLPDGSLLSGVSGNITTGNPGTQLLDLTLSSDNVGRGSAAAPKIDQGSGTLTVSPDATVSIALSPDSLVETLIAHDHDGVESYLTLTSGSLVVNNLDDIPIVPNLQSYGLRVVRAEGGSLVVSGKTQGLYYVTSDPGTTDPHRVEEYPTLGLYAGVIIEQGQTLEVSLPGPPASGVMAAYVNNLTGATGSSLQVGNSGGGTAVLFLHNCLKKTQLQDPATVGPDTVMAGSIHAGTGGRLVKSGSGVLEVSGGLVAEMLRLDDGELHLSGTAENRITALTDASRGARLRLAEGTTLQLTGDSSLGLSPVEGAGTLDLSGTLSLGGAASLQGVRLSLPSSGVLNIGNTAVNTVSALDGAGSVAGSGGTLRIEGGGGRFSGSLSGSGNNLLEVAADASFTMDHVASDASWSVTNAGALTLDLAGESANKSLTLGNLTLRNGGSTTIVLNTDIATDTSLMLHKLTIEDGADVTLKSTGKLFIELDENSQRVIGHVDENTLSQTITKTPLELEGIAAFKHISSAWLTVENNLLLFNADVNTANNYAAMADSPNALAGADLMWAVPDTVLAENPHLRALDEALFELVSQNRRVEANDLMVALSGAAATVQGLAFGSDMERQLRAVRNRGACMGLVPCQEYPDLPYANLWVNAEGNFRKLDADGSDCGYSFNNWGGTLGCSLDLDPYWSLGAAFTAMFGDLSASGRGVGSAEGDMDTYYASLLAHYAHDAWEHSLVLCFGWCESSFRRNVRYAGGGYRADGRTDGKGFGFLYELAYGIPLGEEGDIVLQPLTNVGYARTGLDAYSERGSEAALHFDEQKMNAWEFGLGARLQAPVAETLANHTVQSECRALVKFSAGDRRSTIGSSFVLHPGNGGAVRSADRKRIGVELGAGLGIPLDMEGGMLFMDAAALLWSDTYDFNAVVGYRMEF